MKSEQIEVGKTYEGRFRRGHSVTRSVEAIIPHSGYATMVRFAEIYLSEVVELREITLKSFASWALREIASRGAAEHEHR